MSSVLIAGCGYVGTALGLCLARAGRSVWALRRSISQVPAPLRPLAADLADPKTLAQLPGDIDAVIYAAGADRSDEAAYRAAYVEGLTHLLDAVRAAKLGVRRLLFTSSTSVYEQRAGQWVDESSPTSPTHFTGRTLLEAERIVEGSGIDAVVVRLGGIYGPGRTRLVDSVRNGTANLRPEPVYTNRIHRDDCAGALAHLLDLERPDPVYLGVDDEPADQAVVLAWLAAQLGAPPPAPLGGQPPARSSKRCSNQRLKASGYRFSYPTFREGYASMLSEQAPASTRGGVGTRENTEP